MQDLISLGPADPHLEMLKISKESMGSVQKVRIC